MPYRYLSKTEKLAWLNHISKLENMFENMYNDIDFNSAIVEEGKLRLSLLKEANLFYKNFYKTIKNELLSLLDKNDVLCIIRHPELGDSLSPFTFRYLIRDWGTNKGYDQRVIISSFIQEKLKALKVLPSHNALFIGCGNGRYAVDLAEHYDKVDAFDNSLPMIWSIFNLIKLKKWTVLHKIQKNCRVVGDTIHKEDLKINDEQIELINSKINFFVGDMKTLKLNEESVDHIYSIYFTDVLPLKLLFKQIDRFLNKNGLFIHFGPLDYFFTNENEMMTTQEIKTFFIEMDYEVIADEFFSTRHLFVEKSISHQVYDNWFFIARKGSKKTKSLDLGSKLVLNQNAELISRSIVNNEQVTKEFSVTWNEISYELPKILYCILEELNPKLDLLGVLKQLELNDLEKADLDSIIEILTKLYESNIVKVYLS
jgi:cyclopropane fatty-acyl-phospholipid synthase-like methyltransferase